MGSNPENPETAVQSEPRRSRSLTPKKKKKKRFTNFDNIPGVNKMVLNETTQRNLGCVAGEDVTDEKPWIYIDKELFLEDLEIHNESSEFLPLKYHIMEFPRDQILVGYIPDEAKEFEEFFICLTEAATDKVKQVTDKMQKHQEERLQNAINKKIGQWVSLGSEIEVDENVIRDHRPFIEVEIESKYPILPFKIQFKHIKSQEIRDGYMELRSAEDSSLVVFKKRIDEGTQVTPEVRLNEAQTICTYPSNSYTQYEYEVPPDIAISEELKKNISSYVQQNMEALDDLLKVNGTIDLYFNEYENLVLHPKSSSTMLIEQQKDYLCFIDRNLCGDKMISCLQWHPIWSGLFVASYVDIAPTLYLNARVTTDEVSRAIHEPNPVLLWSLDDDLKPKLMMETPRPVHALSFCPYNENLLIGGLFNGQIIIWDITNKLNRVEEEEVLTIDQQKYREYMFSLMGWMKNTFNLAQVRPTVISDMKLSHKRCVTAIRWMSPFHSVSNTGKINESPTRTLQFLTASEDGSVLIWDLMRKPQIQPGGFKAVKRLKRLTKKPSALLSEESPFKIYHLNLRPIYKINLTCQVENHRLLSISNLHVRFFKILYESTTENIQKLKLSDRVTFEAKLDPELVFPKREFFAGTMEGDLIHAFWEGQEFDSGEVVNFEEAQIYSCGKYHDGPVVNVDYCEYSESILTVGGKIFAIWREDYKNKPILWRKCSSIYTYGSWLKFEESSIKVIRIDGYIEYWSLFYQSKSALTLRLISNGAVNFIQTHQRIIKQNIFGIADYRGSFRLFYMHHETPLLIQTKKDLMRNFILREKQRKEEFFEWQNDWNKRFEYMLSLLEVKEEPKEGPPVFEADPAEKKEKKEKKIIVKQSPVQRYMQMVQEDHEAKELARIKKMILEKKQVDTDVLEKEREPLKKLEEENEVKRRKQRLRHREADRIFKETVAMLFPDVVREKPVPPPDPYMEKYLEEVLEDSYKYYQELAIEAQDYVEDHPFEYDFNWGKVLKTGRMRRRKLDETFDRAIHYKRYEQIKANRAREMGVVEVVDTATVGTAGSKESEVSGMTFDSEATGIYAG